MYTKYNLCISLMSINTITIIIDIMAITLRNNRTYSVIFNIDYFVHTDIL